jgi:hypothetical protein
MTGTNSTRDPDSVLEAWIDEGPRYLPDATRRAILNALPTTPQSRRGFTAPGSSATTTAFVQWAAVAIVAVVAIGALALLTGPRGGVGGPASPSAPNVFRSPFYGYSIAVPTGWRATPATTLWDGESQPSLGPNVDQLAGPHLIVLGYAGPFPGNLAAFVQGRLAANARDHADTCPSNALVLNESITIGDRPGVLLGLNCGARIDQAITVQDGIGYAFTVRDANFSPTLDPADLATVRSMLDRVIFPASPTRSP